MRHSLQFAPLTLLFAACGVSGPTPQSSQVASALTHYPDSSLVLHAPQRCGSECELGAGVEGRDNPVASVRYTADGWPLGESSDVAAGYPLRARFSLGGPRLVRAEAFSRWGTSLGWVETTVEVDVEGEAYAPAPAPASIPTPTAEPASAPAPAPAATADTPYFSQFENRLAPGATCQNTSLAMVLAQYGWQGEPDDITREFGRARAQTPAGLAAVFNAVADRAGLPVRLEPTTSGSLAGLRAELEAGAPVIVHGYFTRSGHVVVVTDFDGASYEVNDPAGRWSERFRGGYPYAWSRGAGHGVRYDRRPFEAAIATADGRNHLPLWYHAIRPR